MFSSTPEGDKLMTFDTNAGSMTLPDASEAKR
jgi:hypothetical protein